MPEACLQKSLLVSGFLILWYDHLFWNYKGTYYHLLGSRTSRFFCQPWAEPEYIPLAVSAARVN